MAEEDKTEAGEHAQKVVALIIGSPRSSLAVSAALARLAAAGGVTAIAVPMHSDQLKTDLPDLLKPYVKPPASK